MAETGATETEFMKGANSENGGVADADRVREDLAKSEKEDEATKATDDQEPEGTFGFRGKHVYLRRAKGKRWRLDGKRTQVRRSDGASTMADNGLTNSSGAEPHSSLEDLTKMEDVPAQENEQLEDKSHETTDDKHEHQGIDVLGRNGTGP